MYRDDRGLDITTLRVETELGDQRVYVREEDSRTSLIAQARNIRTAERIAACVNGCKGIRNDALWDNQLNKMLELIVTEIAPLVEYNFEIDPEPANQNLFTVEAIRILNRVVRKLKELDNE